jgi:hypothetical protein
MNIVHNWKNIGLDIQQELQRDARKLSGLGNLTHPKNSIFKRNKKSLLNLSIEYFFSGNKTCESFKNSISSDITFIKLNWSLIFF